MSPQGRKRAALMISRDQPATIGSGYQTYRKVRRSRRHARVWFLISIRASMTKEKLIDKLYAEEKNIFTRNIREAYLSALRYVDISCVQLSNV